MNDNDLRDALTLARAVLTDTPPNITDMLATTLAKGLVEQHERWLRGVYVPRTRVKSSNIMSVGYNADACVLAVEFSGGRVYRYADVPATVYTALVKADSVGGYFARTIRDKFVTFKPLEQVTA